MTSEKSKDDEKKKPGTWETKDSELDDPRDLSIEENKTINEEKRGTRHG